MKEISPFRSLLGVLAICAIIFVTAVLLDSGPLFLWLAYYGAALLPLAISGFVWWSFRQMKSELDNTPQPFLHLDKTSR